MCIVNYQNISHRLIISKTDSSQVDLQRSGFFMSDSEEDYQDRVDWDSDTEPPLVPETDDEEDDETAKDTPQVFEYADNVYAFPSDTSLAKKLFQGLPRDGWVYNLKKYTPGEYEKKNMFDTDVDIDFAYYPGKNRVSSRVYSDFTLMPKAARAFLYKHEGHNLYEIDFVKCKLYLFYDLAKRIEDEVEFFEVCEEWHEAMRDVDSTFQAWKSECPSGTDIKATVIACITTFKYAEKGFKKPASLMAIAENVYDLFMATVEADLEEFKRYEWMKESQGKFMYSIFEHLEAVQRQRLIDSIKSRGIRIVGICHDAVYATIPDGTDVDSLHSEVQDDLSDAFPVKMSKIGTKYKDGLYKALVQRLIHGSRKGQSKTGFKDRYTPAPYPSSPSIEIAEALGKHKRNVRFYPGKDGNKTEDKHEYWKNLYTIKGDREETKYFMTKDGLEIRSKQKGYPQGRFEAWTSTGEFIMHEGQGGIYGPIQTDDPRFEEHIESDSEYADFDTYIDIQKLVNDGMITMFVKANCGMGKSTAMRRFMEQTSKIHGWRHLLCVPRTTLGKDLTSCLKRLEECGLKVIYHKDEERLELNDFHILVITFESLHKVRSQAKFEENFDTFWMDESETLAGNLNANLSKFSNINKAIFLGYLRHCRLVCCLDAFLGEISVHVGQSERPMAHTVSYVNRRVKYNRKMRRTYNFNQLSKHMHDTLKEDSKPKVWLSAAIPKTVEREYNLVKAKSLSEGETGAIFTSQTSKSEFDEKDIEVSVGDRHRWVGATSCCDVGISIANTKWRHYLDVDMSFGITHQSVAQSIFRARQSETGDVLYHFPTARRRNGQKKGHLASHQSVWVQSCIDALNQSQSETNEALRQQKGLQMEYAFDKATKKFTFIYKKDFWFTLRTHLLANRHRSLHQGLQNLVALLKDTAGAEFYNEVYIPIEQPDEIKEHGEVHKAEKKSMKEAEREEKKELFETFVNLEEVKGVPELYDRKAQLVRDRETGPDNKQTLEEQILDMHLNYPCLQEVLEEEAADQKDVQDEDKDKVLVPRPGIFRMLKSNKPYSHALVTACGSDPEKLKSTIQLAQDVVDVGIDGNWKAQVIALPTQLRYLKHMVSIAFGPSLLEDDDIKDWAKVRVDDPRIDTVWNSITSAMKTGEHVEVDVPQNEVVIRVSQMIKKYNPIWFTKDFVPRLLDKGMTDKFKNKIDGEDGENLTDSELKRTLTKLTEYTVGWTIRSARKSKKADVQENWIIAPMYNPKLLEGSIHEAKAKRRVEVKDPDELKGAYTWIEFAKHRTGGVWLHPDFKPKRRRDMISADANFDEGRMIPKRGAHKDDARPRKRVRLNRN